MKIAMILIGAAWMVCATVEAGKGKARKSAYFLVYTHYVGVIFNRLSKTILYCINFFSSLLSLTSLENSHHLKPIEPFELLCALRRARHVYFQH